MTDDNLPDVAALVKKLRGTNWLHDMQAADLLESLSARVTQAETEARARGVQDALAAIVDGAPPYGFGMEYDGREDPHASAYIEGHHDAWAAVNALTGPGVPATTNEGEGNG